MRRLETNGTILGRRLARAAFVLDVKPLPLSPRAVFRGAVAASLALALGLGCGAVEPSGPGRLTPLAARVPAQRAAKLETPRRTFGRHGPATSGSTLALAHDGARELALIADAEARVLRVVDVGDPEAPREIATHALGARPSQVAISSRGVVYVALRDVGIVVVLERDPPPKSALREITRVAMGGEPVALALTPDDATLLAADTASSALVAIDTRSHEVTGRTPLARLPRGVTTSADGKTAYVAHAVGAIVTTVHLDGSTPATPHERPLRATRADLPKLGPLPVLQTFAVTRAGDRVVMPGVAVATGDVAVRTKDSYGNLGVPLTPSESFRVLDVTGEPRAADPAPFARAGLLADVCLLPRAAAANSSWLYVACVGPGRVFKLSLADEAAKDRWTVPYAIPDGASGLAIDDETHTIWVWSDQEGALTALPTDRANDWGSAQVTQGGPASPTPSTSIHRLREPTPESAETRGRAIFYGTHEPAVSIDGRTCASCHVEGADDGLTWPTPEGPRQTPMLAGRLARTQPYGWTGARTKLGDHLKETIRRLGGKGLANAERDDLIAYLMSLAPPKSAPPEALVARGRAVFQSSRAACATCHAPPLFVDRFRHDVKSRAPGDAAREFDTPSLVGLSHSAPYFHDGRYATLSELLRATDGAMGATKHLSPEDLAALEAYLRSL